jgi:hypothetical protein
MKKLRLRVDKYMESDGGPPPGVFASIYPIDPTSGRNRAKQIVRREMVPISNRAKDVREVALEGV